MIWVGRKFLKTVPSIYVDSKVCLRFGADMHEVRNGVCVVTVPVDIYLKYKRGEC